MTTPKGRKCKNFRCDVMIDTAKEYCSEKCEKYYIGLRAGTVKESLEWNPITERREFREWEKLNT